MSAKPTAALELDDIQAGALQPRPASYAGIYQMLRLDDRHAGREMRRLIPYLDSVASFDPKSQVSLAVALSFQGLKALGVPEESLASFPPEFQQGMAARACELGDVGRTLPSTGRNHWARRTSISCWSGWRPTLPVWRPLFAMPAKPYAIWPASSPSGNRMFIPTDLRNMFGFADGIAHPAVEGSGIPGTNPYEVPLKAGEFVLGYEDEIHSISQIPQPEVLRHNGTYAVFRKLHTRVAAFRQHLRQRAEPLGGGVASRQDSWALAQWCAACTGSREGRY
jgi:deferrochelatase/peroxidase EfeB